MIVFFSYVFIALALSVDALVCSIVYGKCFSDARQKLKVAFIVSIFFGLFQLIMPLIGYFLAYTISGFIHYIDHWIAFGLLALVSLKMLYDTFKKDDENKEADQCKNFSVLAIFILAIATSIDAMSVGFSLGAVNNPIISLAAVTGLICFILSFGGCMLGQVLNKITSISSYLNVFAALVLLSIGISVLVDHKAITF